MGIPTYQWYENTTNSNIGGTIIPGETNASFTPSIFTATGNYYYYCEVSLSGNGCDNIKSDVAHIEVFDTPIPLFSSLDTICVNESPIYVLSNNSFGNILTYNWQIIDTSGNIIWNEIKTDNTIPLFPTANNPVADVKYYISLTVSNNCGDSTLIDSIVIKPTPQLYFNSIYCNSSSIALAEGIPLTLEYSNIGFVNPTNTDTLIIDWGDGLPNDTVLPNCGNIPGYIGNNAVCWQELSHTYYQSGQYTICMTGLNSCGDSTYCCDITVIPNNIRSFFQITSNYNCINESTEFIELSSNGFPNSIVNWWFDYSLNINSNNDTLPPSSPPDDSRPYIQNELITHQYSSPGVYLVYHEINSPAPNLFTDWNISDTVFIYPKPDVSFNTSNTCIYENITFTNNSTIDNSINGMPFQQINNNKWYVNNVFVSASVDLNYTFNNAGPTWIKLECWSNFNCYSVDSVLIDIYDQPRPNFVTTSHCEGESTFFDASSSLGSSLYNSVLDTFYWDLNGVNGIDSINTNGFINYTLPLAGNNNVTLYLKDQFGCIDTLNQSVYIIPEVTTFFSFNDSICGGASINFFNLSSSDADSFSWDFGFSGSNGSSTLTNPQTTFPSGGTYQIILTSYDDINLSTTGDVCINTHTDSIFIYNQPTAQFYSNAKCANEITPLFNTSSIGDAPIVDNRWQFSDSPTYLFNNNTAVAHLYNVNQYLGEIAWAELIVTDNNGCKDTIRNDVLIHPLPTVDFTISPICEGEKLQALDASNMASPSAFPSDMMVSGIWQFNNTTLSNDWPIWNSFTPTNPNGLYPVNLTVTTNFGCEASLEKIITIKEEPKMIDLNTTFNPSNQCGDSVNVVFTSNFDSDKWQFFLDDPYCSQPILPNENNFTYTLCKPHNYLITIILENFNSCTDTIYSNIHTYPNPNSDFLATPLIGCEELSVDFINKSTIKDSIVYHSYSNNESSYISSFYWDFGNGLSSSGSTTVNKYTTINGQDIKYYPSLNVTTNQGCSSSIAKDNIHVFPRPVANIATPPISISNGLYSFDGSNSSISIFAPNTAASISDYWYTWILGSNDINSTPIDTIGANFPPYGDELNKNEIEYQYLSNSFHQGGFDYNTFLIVTLKEYPNCSDTTKIQHLVDYWKGLTVPNALTPNVNNNDVSIFWPKGRSLSDYKLEVFDIWGNIIWESSDLDYSGTPTRESAWDGTINGVPAPQGTYVWRIYAKFSDGEVWLNENGKNTGPIYLIR